MVAAVRSVGFLGFCIALSVAGFFYQTQFLASSRDLNAWSEWTKRPELAAHFTRMGVALTTQSAGSFGDVLAGQAGECSFQIFGADLSGGTGNYFSSFLNDTSKLAFYYRNEIYDIAPTRKVMFLSQIDAMAVSLGVSKEIRPMYAIIYKDECTDDQKSSLFNLGL